MLTVIIPAHNEETTLPLVISGLLQVIKSLEIQTFKVIVVDNASTDNTAEVAQNAGATVVHEPHMGYGSACLAALKTLESHEGWVCFMDGDGADDPQDLAALLAPLRQNQADLVLGSRLLGQRRGWVEKGALTSVQHFGNWLSALLLRWTWNIEATDLGPFRAVNQQSLLKLEMDDRNYGWTIQMQARAARLGLRIVEIPVHYRHRQGGVSKISGTVKGSFEAGRIILKTYFSSLFWKPGA